MKKIMTMVAALAVLASFGSAAFSQQPPSRAEIGEVGRYQLVSTFEGRLFLLDTKTGQCWSRSPNGEWRDEGNPTRGRAGRTARAAAAEGHRDDRHAA